MSELAVQFDGGAISGQDPVPVSEDYEVLVGPLDIQEYDRFTIYIQNVGGLLGNAIESVLLDTSPESDNDALWITVAEVLELPLVAAATVRASYNSESFKYIRLRVKCDAAETTTTRIWFCAGGYE